MAIPEAPITRKEHFLAAAAGETVNTPTPITREEMYLNAIANGGGITPDSISYNDLDNKPSINGVPLVGALTWEDLGIINGNEVAY